MALESRLVEVTNMLRAERARASQLEQRTSRLETQLLTFKAMVLDVMRQSIQLLEKRLAVDEAANSSVLVPPMTASSLIEKKSPAEDHSEERGIKMEDSYQNLRNVGILQNTAKPQSRRSHRTSYDSALGPSLPEIGVTKAFGRNTLLQCGSEPSELDNNDQPTHRPNNRRASAPRPSRRNYGWDGSRARSRAGYMYKDNGYEAQDTGSKSNRSRDTSRSRGRRAQHNRCRYRYRSGSKKRSGEYDEYNSGHNHTDNIRADRSRSPVYRSCKSFGGNAAQSNHSPGIKRHTWTDLTADALDELEQDLKARILSVDRRRDFSNKDTTAGADALRGWDTGQGNNGEDNGGWAISSYDANNKNDRQDTDTGFAMPRSINQIMGKKPVSARNKVLSWQKNTAIGSAEPTDGETANGHTRAVSESTNDDMNDITDIHNIEGRSDTSTDNHPRVQESIPFASASGYDDDDEGGDDEDPLACLGSRTFQAEKAMSLLFDSADTPLTTERLAHLWRASAWIPFDDLPVLYERHYKTELWTHDTRKKTRLYLPKLPGISERQSCNNYKQCMLLFMDGGHLKNAKAYQRVFVRPWIAEPALFFFLTTSVYWPLEYEQAEIIRKMWENEFHHTPVGLVTVKCSDRFEERKWFVMEMLWRSAVDWLKELAQAVINLGCKYMLNKLSSWDDTANISVYMNQNQRSSTMPRDPDADIVYGLSRDELLEVIKMAPVLLQTKISDVDILRLEDELLQPM
ncbi:hypothetical protein IW138_004046 [Coemansia sp. RSA 986]|nr:hypothetical protein IW138_004046 [Coemansia sp. RSA 986]